eukprot:CAMPEP_0194755640 /NCGR_PEP_ID=MMETSP0323_2-20130528/9475_1 /TAXON_ID=2866 ORGANISM="Crypthecodinium cohnii, Strain Seligo" /NCGR_SAMPLE_ID=MMETSP0323_2 /ASSEMBLY_ACC=CAM_ASM_000346 /LENGTH=198 /DNA_ID=CAMNT_0039674781 /DNA_START=266 /DNA_END=858 /DNA_ORIENTATION=+
MSIQELRLLTVEDEGSAEQPALPQEEVRHFHVSEGSETMLSKNAWLPFSSAAIIAGKSVHFNHIFAFALDLGLGLRLRLHLGQLRSALVGQNAIVGLTAVSIHAAGSHAALSPLRALFGLRICEDTHAFSLLASVQLALPTADLGDAANRAFIAIRVRPQATVAESHIIARKSVRCKHVVALGLDLCLGLRLHLGQLR